MKFEGNEIISIDDYDILYSYYDYWKTTIERRNAIFQGIVEVNSQTENAIKHRINAGDKANNAKDQTVASIYDNHFCIPLDFEILESSLPLYQYGLGSRLTYELTFADYSDVIKSMDPDATYTISNISFEFDTIINASLAGQIRTEYMKSSILYDRILRALIIPLNKSDTSLSVDINSPSKLECYMDWFPSLICKNYIFKHFVKTVEPTSLKFCMMIELITLHLEYTIAQVKYANFSDAHAQTFVLLNGEMATVSTGCRKLKFWLWLLRTVFYLSQTGF